MATYKTIGTKGNYKVLEILDKKTIKKLCEMDDIFTERELNEFRNGKIIGTCEYKDDTFDIIEKHEENMRCLRNGY